MSWFRSVILFLLLAACGFGPVYGPDGTGSALRNRVAVDAPRDREGFVLVRQLEDRLGRPQDAAYRLSVSLSVRQENHAIDSDGNTLRYHLIGSARYNLTGLASTIPVVSGTVENFVGYSATGTTVATLAARSDAQERLMTVLADEIVLRLQAASL